MQDSLLQTMDQEMKYKEDLESSEARLNQWKNGKVSAAQRRILFTKWLAEAWEDYTTNCQEEITTAFKKAGMYNDIDGRENHLVKLPGLKEYKPPLKEDPLPELPKKKRKKTKTECSQKKGKASKEVEVERSPNKTGVFKHHQKMYFSHL